jgi:hypothetical protein
VTENSFAGKPFNQANFKGKVGQMIGLADVAYVGTAVCHLAGHHEAMPRGCTVDLFWLGLAFVLCTECTGEG